jgi:hypothetical protein
MRRKRPTEAREEQHHRAVAQTIQWTKDAAIAGHYQDALSWMRVLEAVEGELPAELEPLFDRCLAITRCRAEVHDVRGRGFADVA